MKFKRGLTLIEILMVLALLGLLLSVGLPKIDRITRANVRTGVRRLGALVKYCYDQSVLTGKLHRISFDLADGKTASEQSWKLEMAVGDTLPEEQIKEDLTGSSSSSSESSEGSPSAIQPFVPAAEASKHYLPRGIQIVQVKSWRLGPNVALTQGPISVYCFPNGFVDDATIYLQEQGKPKSAYFIVKTRSLTGRVDIEAEAASGTP
ncbi:MAG: prepilin-type N-terminal cleavage/methylation domain-containing protein [Bdellovibrionota bacterium]